MVFISLELGLINYKQCLENIILIRVLQEMLLMPKQTHAK